MGRTELVSARGLLLLGMSSLVPIVSLLLFVVAYLCLPRLRAALQRSHQRMRVFSWSADRGAFDEVFEETCPLGAGAVADSVSRRKITRFPLLLTIGLSFVVGIQG